MKNSFIGYYTPSDVEFSELWDKARIVVDANVLLDVYGVSPSTREALLSLLQSVKARLWIPYQFAFEYQRNRRGKILEQVKHYENAHINLKAILDDQFRSRRQHPFVSDDVEKGLEQICEHLLVGKSEQEKLLKFDPYFDVTTELFEGKVGASYGEHELKKIYEVGRERFSLKIPPGYKDSDKPEPERYGDYVGWHQLLDFALKENVSVILVTNDAKEDWWRQERGKPIGPRPELVAEFRSCCSKLFYMYPTDRFLEFSGVYLGGTIDPKAISELKERRESATPADSMKSTGATFDDLLPAKSTSYISETAKQILANPKLTRQDIEKPEEER